MSEEKRYPECWVFDVNRRVYRRDANGKACGGGPIWREHWTKVTIADSNYRNWITDRGTKIPKGGGRNYAFSLEEIEQAAFVHDNKHAIGQMILASLDYCKIKKVAEIMGYKPEENRDEKT